MQKQSQRLRRASSRTHGQVFGWPEFTSEVATVCPCMKAGAPEAKSEAPAPKAATVKAAVVTLY